MRTKQGDHRCDDHQREVWSGQSDRKRTLPPLSQAEKDYIRERDYHVCRVCGEPAHEVDHIVEAADGGDNRSSNLQLLCDKHHHAKTRRSQADRAPRRKVSARADAKRRRRRMGLYQQ